MVKNLNDIIRSLKVLKKFNSNFYSYEDFLILLNELKNKKIKVEDSIMLPFYICDNKQFELYDYELNIRLVDFPNVDSYILMKTGKASISAIDPLIEQKLRNCYLEASKSDKLLLVQSIIDYIDYTRNSQEIRERVREIFDEFFENKLYFEFY